MIRKIGYGIGTAFASVSFVIIVTISLILFSGYKIATIFRRDNNAQEA